MILVEACIADPAPLEHRRADYFEIEWYETFKTTFRRNTKNGVEIAIRKSNRIPLSNGDILWENERSYIQVHIKPCDCIVLKPRSIKEMGIICFEIGNMHIPIAISEEDIVSVAYESPLYSLLEKKGYQPDIVNKQLLNTHFFSVHSMPQVINL